MRLRFSNCLVLVAALTLAACPSTNPKKDATKPAKTDTHVANDETEAIDFQAFLGRLRKAVAAHDVNALAAMMTVDFGYRLEPVASGPGVFQYWDEKGLWVELQAVVAERFVQKDAYMVAPPQFAEAGATYNGYRAGIRRVNGSWKFAYFVNG